MKESFIEVDYGSLDGQPLSSVTEEQWRAFEHDHDTAFGDGESLASVDQRVHAELDALLARSDEPAARRERVTSRSSRTCRRSSRR